MREKSLERHDEQDYFVETQSASDRLHTFEQATAYVSPWTWNVRVKMALWKIVWLLLFRPSPKYMVLWRNWLLRCFGCRISGRPFVASSAVIKMPWNLVLEDRACIGPGTEVYNLGPVILKARCTVAQQVYLCAGTHDFSRRELPLMVGAITIGEDAFIGVWALILPGVSIGAGAVVGAGSVVVRDLPEWMICAGNPCQPIKPRQLSASQ